MTPAAAEALARDGLYWLATRPDDLARFLAETGADPQGILAGLGDPGVLGAVLDFLLADEARLLAFAGAHGLDPALGARARAALAGGDLPHWT